jgi:hypothetical protein
MREAASAGSDTASAGSGCRIARIGEAIAGYRRGARYADVLLAGAEWDVINSHMDYMLGMGAIASTHIHDAPHFYNYRIIIMIQYPPSRCGITETPRTGGIHDV